MDPAYYYGQFYTICAFWEGLKAVTFRALWNRRLHANWQEKKSSREVRERKIAVLRDEIQALRTGVVSSSMY